MKSKITQSNNVLDEELTKVVDSHMNKLTTRVTLFLGAMLTILLALVGITTDVKLDMTQKANAAEVVTVKNAQLIEELRVANIQRNFSILADTTSKMDLIKQNNEDYLRLAEKVYNSNNKED